MSFRGSRMAEAWQLLADYLAAMFAADPDVSFHDGVPKDVRTTYKQAVFLFGDAEGGADEDFHALGDGASSRRLETFPMTVMVNVYDPSAATGTSVRVRCLELVDAIRDGLRADEPLAAPGAFPALARNIRPEGPLPVDGGGFVMSVALTIQTTAQI